MPISPTNLIFCTLSQEFKPVFLLLEAQMSAERYTERSFLWRKPLFRSTLGGLLT